MLATLKDKKDGKKIVLPDDSRFVRFNDFIKNVDTNNLITPASFEKDRPSLIVQSSGSTGKPKQIVHTEYNFNLVGNELYKFIWEDFCDNYIEFSKVSSSNLSTKSTLLIVLTGILQMLHPFMPFVTDEIYNSLPIKEENILLSNYPKYNEEYVFASEEKEIDSLINIISTVRGVKLENNIPKDFELVSKFENKLIDNNEEILTKLLKCVILKSSTGKNSMIEVTFPYGKLELYYDSKEQTLEDTIMVQKEIDSLKNSIERRKKLLSNPGYVSKAPSNIVESERIKLKEEEDKLNLLIQKI